MAGAPREEFLLSRVGIPVVLRVGSVDVELGCVDVPIFAQQWDRHPGQRTAAVGINARFDGAGLHTEIAAMLRRAADTLEEGSAHGG